MFYLDQRKGGEKTAQGDEAAAEVDVLEKNKPAGPEANPSSSAAVTPVTEKGGKADGSKSDALQVGVLC